MDPGTDVPYRLLFAARPLRQRQRQRQRDHDRLPRPTGYDEAPATHRGARRPRRWCSGAASAPAWPGTTALVSHVSPPAGIRPPAGSGKPGHPWAGPEQLEGDRQDGGQRTDLAICLSGALHQSTQSRAPFTLTPSFSHRIERTAEVLDHIGMFLDDRPSSFDLWLERKLDGLAAGIRRDVEDWSRLLHEARRVVRRCPTSGEGLKVSACPGHDWTCIGRLSGSRTSGRGRAAPRQSRQPGTLHPWDSWRRAAAWAGAEVGEASLDPQRRGVAGRAGGSRRRAGAHPSHAGVGLRCGPAAGGVVLAAHRLGCVGRA